MTRETYILKYLSKIWRLRNEGHEGEFFCVEKPDITEALSIFDWKTKTMPVIQYEPNAHMYAKEAIGFAIPETGAILMEDVDALRKGLGAAWSPTIKTENRLRIVLVEDGHSLTESLVRELEDVLEKAWDVRVVYPNRTSAERFRDVMSGAWGVVCGSGLGAAGWNWMLPTGAYVFEVESTSGEGLGLSGAAGLEHTLLFWNKVTGKERSMYVLEEIWKEEKLWKKHLEKEPSEDIPTIWIPREGIEGFYAHPGDSFREMVKLWKARGYVQVKQHPIATMVWWGDVGKNGTLLYDRPTNEWRLAAPMVEQSWSRALFGNPKPDGIEHAIPWSFWPRRPELVEQLATEETSGREWASRTKQLVFYGKVENRVQARRRCEREWKTCCSEFVLVEGEKTPYPYTHSEYLLQLSMARFGLCLAGYGLKCHREVECMAMGCVPVVSPEVDMDSYAEPLIEGVHYIRVQTPEEATQKINACTEETWEPMSQACRAWWKRNASCEGMFELTKRLSKN